MRLILFHPGPASIDCEECKRFIFDLKTGRRETFKSGPKREEKPCVRPGKILPPCDQCPKESPEKAHEHELSDRNRQTVRLYHQVRATQGGCMTEAMKADRLLARNLAIVDQLYREWEREQAAKELAYQVAVLYQR